MSTCALKLTLVLAVIPFASIAASVAAAQDSTQLALGSPKSCLYGPIPGWSDTPSALKVDIDVGNIPMEAQSYILWLALKNLEFEFSCELRRPIKINLTPTRLGDAEYLITVKSSHFNAGSPGLMDAVHDQPDEALESSIAVVGGAKLSSEFMAWVNSSCQWSKSRALFWTTRYRNPERDVDHDIADGDFRFAYFKNFVGEWARLSGRSYLSEAPYCPTLKVKKFKIFGPDNPNMWPGHKCYSHVITAAQTYVQRYNLAKSRDARVPSAVRDLCKLVPGQR
jgi:hypothetical protein